jgi:hypothetical protein
MLARPPVFALSVAGGNAHVRTIPFWLHCHCIRKVYTETARWRAFVIFLELCIGANLRCDTFAGAPALSITGCKPSPCFLSLTRLVTTQDCTWTHYFIGHVGNMRAGRLGQGLNCVCVAAGVLLAHYLLEI